MTNRDYITDLTRYTDEISKSAVNGHFDPRRDGVFSVHSIPSILIHLNNLLSYYYRTSFFFFLQCYIFNVIFFINMHDYRGLYAVLIRELVFTLPINFIRTILAPDFNAM